MKNQALLIGLFTLSISLLQGTFALASNAECCKDVNKGLPNKACTDGVKDFSANGDEGIRLCGNTSRLFTDEKDRGVYFSFCSNGFQCARKDAKHAATNQDKAGNQNKAGDGSGAAAGDSTDKAQSTAARE